MTGAYLANGVHTQYTPNERNQLTNIISKNSANTTLLSFAYDLDKAGNRTKATELGGSSITWGYDNLYRLMGETRRNSSNTITWQAGFTYDAAGNRASMTVNGATTNYTYNALDQLTNIAAVTYNYDGRGNLNKITNGTQITNYTYNAADQLSNVTLPNATNITYGYDADGRRVKQTVGSTVTNYQWDEASAYGDVVNEYNGSGSTLASYVLGGTGLISQTRGTTTSYFLQDGQGSTRALTSSSSPATITDTYSYNAFGDFFSRTGSTTNPYQYTGQQLDSLTSLYSLRARYYNPALGRFLSQDTYPVNVNNPVELNRYVYTANGPINRMDPSGQGFGEFIIQLGNLPKYTPVIIAVGLATLAVMYAIHQLVGTQEATMTWERILALEEQQSNLAPDQNPTAFPPPLPYRPTPSVPTPQPTGTRKPGKNVLIIGEGNFTYTDSLHLLHPDWSITSTTYGDGSNSQITIGTDGKVTYVVNVDATRLDVGAVTGANRYDAVVFNNPYAGANGERTASLISSFIQSAHQRLVPNGQIHINVTKQLLLDFADVRVVLGVPNTSSIDYLRTFGQTPYYAPHIPIYSDGNIMRFYGEDINRVRYLKNFVFR